jgi:RNA polymerase sigma-70 factor (ECF subfamily)
MAPADERPERDPARDGPEAESTFQLLERAHGGDASALDALFARYLRPLQHWASGRLPRWARDAGDTHDLVQDTLLNTFRRIGRFEPRREGAFQAYLRQAVMNRIRDELRRAGTRPARATFDEDQHPHDESPLEHAIGVETFERYEAALQRLTADEREAIIARVELGHTYEDLATHLGKPSPDAARMTVTRALVRLAEEMRRDTAQR